VLSLFIWTTPAHALRDAVPAQIVYSGPGPDSVGYVTSTGTGNINAQIGRWDTPYPYPNTGEYAPGLQPTGYSTFVIDVDVNDGGLVSFRYMMQTYDAGRWDWYDILLETPTGTISIVQNLGKPGNNYGTYWKSANVAISQSLDKWRNQRVRFVFRIMQDGWGDQTQGQVINFAVRTCDVPPLTPVTDPTAGSFENGNTIDTANLTQNTSAGLDCMRQRVSQLGGMFSLSSAYRPVAYQEHLREVWDTWMAIRNKSESECELLKADVMHEFQRHGLLVTQRPAAGNPNAPHSRGLAFDSTIRNLTTGNTVDTVAAACNMYRPWPGNDPVHYQPRP
jgi:hypothetical protein